MNNKKLLILLLIAVVLLAGMLLVERLWESSAEQSAGVPVSGLEDSSSTVDQEKIDALVAEDLDSLLENGFDELDQIDFIEE